MAKDEGTLVSMRRPKRKESAAAPTAVAEDYSFGLGIRLENFELDALKMKTPEVGQEFTVRAKVKVTNVYRSASVNSEDEDRGVQLQITAMAIGK